MYMYIYRICSLDKYGTCMYMYMQLYKIVNFEYMYMYD